MKKITAAAILAFALAMEVFGQGARPGESAEGTRPEESSGGTMSEGPGKGAMPLSENAGNVYRSTLYTEASGVVPH